ncbi:MAG: chromosome segregation protein SMC, partial [Legionellales bacterium]
KSNIIDAVRWVMGESSAKNLRGESMTDVIFNGSSTRKPLGQASVELVFDNSLGRLVGPFASYGEIAVKRVVTRDSESFYYLNGGRCRRRDITDIFLGTGAGARSYSIIGQGTISRMIEAKPEEIRAFLEEAAGVSKYKERRRETLQRIEHTREHLTRVVDIRDELEKQVQRLERQAKAAERYTQLKEQEHLYRTEIMALKWQDFTQQQLAKQKELTLLNINQEQQFSVLTGLGADRTLLQEQINEANDRVADTQRSLYQLGTEIARQEEVIQQKNREKNRLEEDRQQVQADWQLADQQVKQDHIDLESSALSAANLETQVAQLRDAFKEQELQWQETQQLQVAWEQRWQEVHTATSSLKKDLQIEKLKEQHAEQRHQEIIIRLEKITLEQESISITELEQTKQRLQEQHLTLKEIQEQDEQQVHLTLESAKQQRAQLEETEKEVHQLQDAFYRLNSELAALTAAQQSVRQGTSGYPEGIKEWSDKSRLMDVLQVDAKWQAVCERVLSESLQAYVLDTFEELVPQWATCELQGEWVVTLGQAPKKHQSYPSLADKIKGLPPVTRQRLETIYTAEQSDQALSWLPNLLDHESVVTPDGSWFGKGWAQFAHSSEYDEAGVLARQQKIGDLTAQVQELHLKMDSLRAIRDSMHTQLQERMRDSELAQSNLNASNDALRAHNSALISNEQSMLHALRHLETRTAECEVLQTQLEEVTESLMNIKETLVQLEEQFRNGEQQQQLCISEKQQWVARLAVQSKEVEELRRSLHQSELQQDRELTKTQQLKDRITREQDRLALLQERLEHIAHLCQKSTDPGFALQEHLDQLLLQHAHIESQLILNREQCTQFKIQLEEYDKIALNYDQELKRIHEVIAQTQMQEQALSVRASAIQESLDESQVQASVLLEQIPEGVTQSLREDALIALAQKIKNLGAINLAAIEEFSQEQERKQYLDAQCDDLHQALTTLESAIEKMDKETRQRLETTFDEVNTSFKELFPRLFGGGRAQLELTCDNLLEAGIVVMAQPPGKRNSTIHLLSGGEKAMTAVALVFAIFRLNPSPFCMLDEVDAPLDDVNVSRFCDLVKEMSQFVQFLFISHNKVTMELADHLIGVTMREPGVSRLVTVDVKHALTME